MSGGCPIRVARQKKYGQESRGATTKNVLEKASSNLPCLINRVPEHYYYYYYYYYYYCNFLFLRFQAIRLPSFVLRCYIVDIIISVLFYQLALVKVSIKVQMLRKRGKQANQSLE
jgi:hypothetical protein